MPSGWDRANQYLVLLVVVVVLCYTFVTHEPAGVLHHTRDIVQLRGVCDRGDPRLAIEVIWHRDTKVAYASVFIPHFTCEAVASGSGGPGPLYFRLPSRGPYAATTDPANAWHQCDEFSWSNDGIITEGLARIVITTNGTFFTVGTIGAPHGWYGPRHGFRCQYAV